MSTLLLSKNYLNDDNCNLRPSQDEDSHQLADLQPEPDRPDQHSVQQHLQLHLHEEQVRFSIGPQLAVHNRISVSPIQTRLMSYSDPGTGYLVSSSAD